MTAQRVGALFFLTALFMGTAVLLYVTNPVPSVQSRREEEEQAVAPEPLPGEEERRAIQRRMSAGRDRVRCGRVEFPGAWVCLAPVWSCPFHERIPAVGDGGKWVCNLHLLPTNTCVVYSFGSNREVDFESEVAARKHCEIHIYDPTVDLPPDPRWVFHKVGLYREKRENLPKLGPVDTLFNFVRANRHKHIDILKIDIEGTEWSALEELLKSTQRDFTIGQMQIEYHDPKGGARMVETVRAFEAIGLIQFSLEVNALYTKAAELSFVNLSFHL